MSNNDKCICKPVAVRIGITSQPKVLDMIDSCSSQSMSASIQDYCRKDQLSYKRSDNPLSRGSFIEMEENQIIQPTTESCQNDSSSSIFAFPF